MSSRSDIFLRQTLTVDVGDLLPIHTTETPIAANLNVGSACVQLAPLGEPEDDETLEAEEQLLQMLRGIGHH